MYWGTEHSLYLSLVSGGVVKNPYDVVEMICQLCRDYLNRISYDANRMHVSVYYRNVLHLL